MPSFEQQNTDVVVLHAKRGDRDALYEMAWRTELMKPNENTQAGQCAWQDYWWAKAADAGNIIAKGRLARSLVNRIFDVNDRSKAIGYFDSLVKDMDAGKFSGNADYLEEGVIAKLWLGAMLCQGFGMGEWRDPVRGERLLREADDGTNGFQGFGFRVLGMIAEVYGQGAAKKGGEPSTDDLRQAIAYQKKAVAVFNLEKDDPNNRGFLQIAKEYLAALEARLQSKEQLKDIGFDPHKTINPDFDKWRNRMMEISPAGMERKAADKAALAQITMRLSSEGW